MISCQMMSYVCLILAEDGEHPKNVRCSFTDRLLTKLPEAGFSAYITATTSYSNNKNTSTADHISHDVKQNEASLHPFPTESILFELCIQVLVLRPKRLRRNAPCSRLFLPIIPGIDLSIIFLAPFDHAGPPKKNRSNNLCSVSRWNAHKS